MGTRKIFFLFSLSVIMLCALFPATGFATASDSWWSGQTPAGDAVSSRSAAAADWDISKSKTVTNLDESFQSQITLSLPSAEEPLVTDVVFVLDESSCSGPVKTEVAQLLDSLYSQIAASGATIKIGAVQFRGEITSLPLTELTETTKVTVTDFMGRRPSEGGSNMSAGLLAGEAMLDADPSAAASRKYLILVSDGITYIWDDEATPAQENYGVNFANGDAPDQPILAGPDGWDVKHGNGYVLSDWKAELSAIAVLADKTVEEKASVYVRGADISPFPFVAHGEKGQYASTVDIALYKCYQVYQRILSKYSHSYVVMAGVENEMAVYPFGPSFMKYLAGGREFSFSDIQKEIVYLLDAGSIVVDTMGKTAEYDFDFVNDPGKLSLTVGGTALPVEKTKENRYGFGSLGEGGYRFELEYIPESAQAGDSFVWYINEAVTITQPVQLTYSVALTNPQTTPGAYGQYDRDGSKGYDGLYTNNSAVLSPVNSNSQEGAPEAFAKPTVSYNVIENNCPTMPIKPDPNTKPDGKPEDSNPNTGAGSFEGVLASLVTAGISSALLALKRRAQK